jgi:Tol biopolymer transport system component
VAALASGHPAAAQSLTVLASVSTGGVQASNVSSDSSISADGRFVVFQSNAASLAGPCPGGGLAFHAYVRDLGTRTTTCVSVATDGSQMSTSGGANAVALSADGRFVAFESNATLDGCVADPFSFGQIFVRDLAAGQTTCVSVGPSGGANGGAVKPSISGDGRFVVFASTATNLGSCTAGNGYHVFLRDRMAGTTTCVSVATDGTPDNSGVLSPANPVISADGRVVAFDSTATNLDPNCATGSREVYVRDFRQTPPTTTCVSRDLGNPVGGIGPALSADGRFLLFSSSGLSLGPCALGVMHAYVRDLTNGTTSCASLAADGTPLSPVMDQGLMARGDATLSGDGRVVAFSHLGSGPALADMGCPVLPGQATTQVFVRHLALGTTVCASGDQSGAMSQVTSARSRLSHDGQVVTFHSDGINLAPDDQTSGSFNFDVFVRGPQVTLTVARQGGGTVTSVPAGIACGADCAQGYLRGTIVTLTGVPDAGSVFPGFGGECASGPVAMLTLTADRACTATFLPLVTLTVSRSGSGSGFVFSEPSGITCGTDCSEVLPSGTQLTLRPIALGGSVFTGFGGDPDCVDGGVTLGGGASCTAAFALLSLGTGSAGLGGGTAAGESLSPSLSADGRLVAFESSAADLTVECPTPIKQVYVRDRLDQSTRCVSRAANGQPGTAASERPTLSADGRIVAFQSSAPNLVPGCTVAGTQIFARALDTLVTQCVSVGLNGAAANAPSGNPVVSRDGRFVAFRSDATNLTPGCASGVPQIFVRDLVAQTTACVSRDPGGAPGNLASGAPAINRDGTVVAFHSSASNFLASGCVGGGLHVFVWDRASGAITCLSRAPGGAPGDGASETPALSDEGTVVAFESDATNLAAPCTSPVRQIQVVDRAAGTVRCVSVDADGVAGTAASTQAAVSGNGLVVAFATGAANLIGGGTLPQAAVRGVLGQTGDLGQVMRRNLGVVANVTELMSQGGNGPGNAASRRPVLSQDGRVVAFETRASDLLPGDANGVADVVVADGGATVTPPATDRPRLTSPLAFSQFPLAGPTPVTFAWTSLAGVTRYGFEFSGVNRTFANPNGTAPDGVNGFGGAGGGLVVGAATFTATLGPGMPPGVYQVRVVALSPSLQVVGVFSDAVTLILGEVPSAIPVDARVTLTGPTTPIQRGVTATLEWGALVGVTRYLLEFTAPNGQFAVPNTTLLSDPGAAGRVPVTGTRVSAVVPLDLVPGTYQVRVIGLSATDSPVGSFSDALTLTVE